MAKKPQTYPLRYVEDFFDVSNDVESNYRNAQQEIIFHHPVRSYFAAITQMAPCQACALSLARAAERFLYKRAGGRFTAVGIPAVGGPYFTQYSIECLSDKPYER